MSCLNATEVNCDEVYYAYVPAMYIYVLVVIIVFGLSGNFLSLIVFEAQRRGKGPATLGLLTCLAIADSLYLISNIFSRLLPTLSKYVYLGEQLLWSMEIRPYCTVWASIFCFYGILCHIAQIFDNRKTTSSKHMDVEKEDKCHSNWYFFVFNCIQHSQIF